MLRDSLLEQSFKRVRRPKMTGFRKIPKGLRTSVDSKQVGQYLDRVLEITGELGLKDSASTGLARYVNPV